MVHMNETSHGTMVQNVSIIDAVIFAAVWCGEEERSIPRLRVEPCQVKENGQIPTSRKMVKSPSQGKWFHDMFVH